VHGLVGYSFRIAGADGRDTIVHPSHLEDDAPHLALGSSCSGTELRTAFVTASPIRGSWLVHQAFPQAKQALAVDATKLADLTVRLLVDHQLVFVYVGDPDAAAHRHGLGSRPHIEALAGADRIFGELCRRLTACTLTLLADHGMVPVERSHELWRYILRTDLAAVAGESRAVYLYARKGCVDRLREHCLAIPGATVVTRREVEERMLLGGKPSREVASRVGDVLVTFERAGAGVVWSDAPGQRAAAQHGGLSDAELLVPFVRLAL
jgi:hypothetical protein